MRYERIILTDGASGCLIGWLSGSLDEYMIVGKENCCVLGIELRFDRAIHINSNT